MANGGKNSKKFNSYDIKEAEWRGRVSEALDNIGTELIEFKETVCRLDKRLTAVQIKVAGVAAVVSFIISAGIFVLSKVLKGG